jgi:hypothetical protein
MCVNIYSAAATHLSPATWLPQAQQKNLEMLAELRARQQALKERHCKLLQVRTMDLLCCKQ